MRSFTGRIHFVASQAIQFEINDWQTKRHSTCANADEVATVALFLAQTTFGHEIPRPAWFRHRNELTALANGVELRQLIMETEFEPSRFASMLDAALTAIPAWRRR